MILIMMVQLLFFDVFFEKDPHLNAVEQPFLLVFSAKSYFLVEIIARS